MHPSTKWYWANHKKARKRDNERLRKWRRKNKKKIKEKAQQWIANNRARYSFLCWRSGLRNDFGMGVEDYAKLLVAQKGGCAICGKKPKKERLCVDHCHATMKIRGLLCRRCNLGLGLFDDDMKRVVNAGLYLKGRKRAKVYRRTIRDLRS